MVRARFTFVAILLVLSFSCKNEQNPSITSDFDVSEPDIDSERETVKQIFYSIYLPTEMSRVFESVGANFDPDIVSSAENFSQYTEDFDIALGLGVYGVDLSYARLFDQSALMARYFSNISIMAGKLGIPEEYYENKFREVEENFSNRDSVIYILTDIYEKTDEYLKTNGKSEYASIIMLGAWAEALFIASEIFGKDPTNMEIMDRIAEQKYSLNSIISLLSNYHDNIRITEYLLMLKRLRKAYDRFEIYYYKTDLEIDTVEKYIAADDYKSEFEPSIANEIIDLIHEIRMDIIY